MRSRKTFEQILVAVVPQNIHMLENEARAASSLATTYPEHADAFRAMESKALRQVFHIVAHEFRRGDLWTASGSEEDRSASMPSSIVYDQERGFADEKPETFREHRGEK